MGYSPQVGKKSDTTEQLIHTHTHTHTLHTQGNLQKRKEPHGYHLVFLVLTEEKEARSSLLIIL